MPDPTTNQSLPTLSFFGDSSSRDKTYMVAGGFAVSGGRISEIEDAIATLREEAGIKSEFHWAEYRGGKRKDAYEALVKYAFDLINRKHAAFHVIIAKFEGYNHKAKDGENKDTSVNRMYFQLLLHRVARLYGSKRAIHVRLDAGNDCADICASAEPCAPPRIRSIIPSQIVFGLSNPFNRKELAWSRWRMC